MRKSLIILLSIFFILNINCIIFANEIEEETDYVWLYEEIEKTSSKPTEEPALSSRYICALDRESKEILYGKDENKRVPMASTTKIMTAIVLMENLKNAGLELSTQIEVCKEAASIGGSRLGLKTGDKITVNDLLYGLMLCSGNDCGIQIAVSVVGSVENFANLMNEKANELKLKDTHFITPHGLDENEHYTTAYELALIADYALNIEKIKEVVKTANYTTYINGYPKTIHNTNELLGSLAGVTGVKTGFTNGAGRCLVTSVERNDFNIITVVLGADTKKIRTKDSIKLIEYIYSNYELVNLSENINNEFIKWCNINKNRIHIDKAKNKDIKIKLEENIKNSYPIKKENIKDIEIKIINENTYFEAPVYKETKIANLKVFIDNKEIISLKIYIDNNIERKDWKDYFRDCLITAKF